MKFKQFYLGCLAHASYYISSNGEAAVIDPQRDVTQYLDEAEANGDKIKYVIETHSHADFVSGQDLIVIDRASFGLGAADALSLVNVTEPLATGTQAQFLFETDSARLWFDADGTGQVHDAVLVATLSQVGSLQVGDFALV